MVIHDGQSGQKIRKLFAFEQSNSVTFVEWSISGKYLVMSSDFGRVVSKQLEVKGEGQWAVFPVINLELGEPILQLVFSNDERLLLISTDSRDCVWDLKGKLQLCQVPRADRAEGKWLADPMNTDMALWINGKNINQYLWTNLTLNEKSNHLQREIGPADGVVMVVKKVALTANSQNMVYEVAPHLSTGPTSLWILSTSSLSYSWKADLSERVRSFLGMIEDKVVFLDYEHWLCTWEIDAKSVDIHRHFFLPNDLLNTGALQLARHTRQGTVYFPKFGSVIIIRNGIQA